MTTDKLIAFGLSLLAPLLANAGCAVDLSPLF